MRLTQDQWLDIAKAFDRGRGRKYSDLNWCGLCHAAEKFSSNDVKELSKSMGYMGQGCWEYDHHLCTGLADNYDNFYLPRVMFSLLMAELCECGEYERLFN
jgi:hypothetical protein